MAAKSAIGKLNRQRTCLLLCDMQERFRPVIWRMETVLHTAQYLTSVAKVFDMPIVGTQQYTKAFGETLPECFADPNDLKTTPIFEKKLFSMVTEDVQSKLSEIETSFVSDGIPAYILVGIETHVCIQQTCLDLLEAGKEVHVIVDGVSSQQPIDRQVALQRMQQAGAFLTTAQSAAFMLTRTAEDPLFKQVSKLTIEHMKKPNEFNEALK
jgi:nicotinamidase-related amidase